MNEIDSEMHVLPFFFLTLGFAIYVALADLECSMEDSQCITEPGSFFFFVFF